ncbi:MAG: hypothetical protein WDN28_14840 [Chthoniobacter sp.]
MRRELLRAVCGQRTPRSSKLSASATRLRWTIWTVSRRPSILLDADAGRAAYGGTGRQLDPALAAEAARRFPEVKFVLAGGLKPENVAEAVRLAQPYAVDVASGVEAAPGRKDREKMTRFPGRRESDLGNQLALEPSL